MKREELSKTKRDAMENEQKQYGKEYKKKNERENRRIRKLSIKKTEMKETRRKVKT